MKLLSNMVGLIIFFSVLSTNAHAQGPIQEYVDGIGAEKLKKNIVVDRVAPQTAAGFGDGHGRGVVLFKKEHIPDTIALITSYIYDLGTTTVSRGGNSVVTTYSWVSPAGGNALANGILEQSLDAMKKEFLREGIVLLTPNEFLNTEAKKSYYYNQFKPEISKLGTFLSNLENKHTDIAVAADYYRCFDISAASDHLRSQSYGSDLAGKLGVDGVLSIAVELHSDNKSVNIHGVKMALHGPNTIPKEDKNYVAQKMGNGYYDGQIYAYLTYFFPKPIKVGSFDRKKLEGEKKKMTVMEGMNFSGIDVVLASMIRTMEETMIDAVEKAGRKYNK